MQHLEDTRPLVPVALSSLRDGSRLAGPGRDDISVSISSLGMVITGVIAIAGSFVVALVYTMWASAGAVTDTHCRVWNWLPSFSAVIGHSHISAALWRSGVTVLFLFRIGSALLYHKWHTATGPATLAYTLARAPPASTALPSLSPTHSLNGFNNNGGDAGTGRNSATFVPDSLSFAPSSVSAPASTSASALVCGGSVRAERLYTYLNWVHSALIVVENVALAELSFITSKDSGATHEALFGLFVLCGTANMFVQLALFALKPLPPLLARASTWRTSTPGAAAGVVSPAEEFAARCARSVRLKRLFCALWLLLLVAAAALFVRHNARCEPGVYSLFALSEYALVGVNMAFHATLAVDFPRGGYVVRAGPLVQ